MKDLLNKVACALATVTYASAVAGAGTASVSGMYEPKAPVSLTK